MKKPGIHFRLLLAAIILIGATSFTIDLLGVTAVRRFMHKRFEDRIRFLAKYLALNSEVGILIGDRLGLKSLALNLLGEEDVAGVVIFDHYNTPLVELSRPIEGPLRSVESPVILKKSRDENQLFQKDIGLPFGPREIKDREFIGRVRITYSTQGIEQLIIEMTRNFILFTVCIVILAGVVFHFISRSIIREVSYLAGIARQVGRGDIELRASPGRLPETNDLAFAFNAMLDSLNESRRAYERINRQMIKQKTLAEVGKFSMMIAHEVKNPLSIIKSSFDILKKDLPPNADPTIIHYIEDEIRRLNALIEDFLTFSRPVKPVFREVDLNGMLRDILSRFDILNIDETVTFQAQIPEPACYVNVDPDLMIRAISNIVKNASEADRNQGRVDITAACHNGEWALTVRDHGEGILAENLPRIFEPFFTTRSKGTGLGLAFAAQVVDTHGGRITAENAADGGAKFCIRIPMHQDGTS